jgi:hypothetical protein
MSAVVKGAMQTLVLLPFLLYLQPPDAGHGVSGIHTSDKKRHTKLTSEVRTG